MILSIGEILVDAYKENDNITYCVGGAPFNVAVNAKQCGAKVGFIGKVGEDSLGKFCIGQCKKAGLDYLFIDVDKERATTQAIVTLIDGERSFRFSRNNTADYHIDAEKMNFSTLTELSIVHLGSLMLSEAYGQKAAFIIADKIAKAGLKMSFDVNFRLDLYDNIDNLIAAYSPFVERADILKFSVDEILLYTKESTLEDAINKVKKDGQLLLITLGKDGSMYVYNGCTRRVPAEVVTPVDTTGAGDAFFGAFLAMLDGKDWTEDTLVNALKGANAKGREATTFLGAIRL